MSLTAQTIVTKAFNKLGIYVPSDTISVADMADGVELLDILLKDWAGNHNLMVWAVTQENFPLVANVNEYSIGVGGDFNTARPENIENAFVRQSNTDFSLDILKREQYVSIMRKTASGRPTGLYFDPQYPIAKIFLHLTPSTNYTLFLDMRKQFTALTSETDTVIVPDNYLQTLIYSLAEEMSLTHEVNGTTLTRIIKKSKDGMKMIKGKNFVSPKMKSDFPSGGGRANGDSLTPFRR